MKKFPSSLEVNRVESLEENIMAKFTKTQVSVPSRGK